MRLISKGEKRAQVGRRYCQVLKSNGLNDVVGLTAEESNELAECISTRDINAPREDHVNCELLECGREPSHGVVGLGRARDGYTRNMKCRRFP